MVMRRFNRKFAKVRADGYFAVRVFHQRRKGKKDASFLFKCGCCDQKFRLYYGDDSLEIHGVMGSIENWRELLLPLLEMKLPGQGPMRRNSPLRAQKRPLDRRGSRPS